jgi:NAD(P)-dependent dehydrogenase (short-subunit alcohol dehydrogenase family)
VRLAREGAAVALLARGEAGLRETRQKTVNLGARTLVIPADLSKPKSVTQAKDMIKRNLGSPSILINATGVFGPIDMVNDSDPAAWIDTLMINTIAPYLMCRAFVGGVISAGWGARCERNLSRRIARTRTRRHCVCHQQSGSQSVHASPRGRVEGSGVTANVIHPGDVKTDMWAYIRDASERLSSVANTYVKWANWVDQTGGDNPEKAADLVASLMRDDAAKINGRFLWIKDGLQNPIPSWGEPGKPQPSR